MMKHRITDITVIDKVTNIQQYQMVISHSFHPKFIFIGKKSINDVDMAIIAVETETKTNANYCNENKK